MADLIYSPNPASIPRFLRHMQTAGVPPKVTQAYLIATGFKTKNDRALISILKALGFTNNVGEPSELWSDYRDKSRSRVVLGQTIKAAYADLFATYPDADRKDVEAIRNFLSSKTKVADSTLRLAVSTFRTLAGEATFDATAPATPVLKITGSEDAPLPKPIGTLPAGSASGAAININIELHLPETDDADVYDKLFAAMRKHLL